ncbi:MULTISPECIES: BLUF domain-containing protein [Psychrobacter]|uniref:FAD-dependent sensor of blue light n=1 Tax=Psychrobacter fozii TaxID=198480 RepID=A0A2V4UNB1_9GAMM|nr:MULTISPECIES: BLUF domain-containing protein [Psychrobacter]MBH0065926.1 BLUF domain-containing protein [Psychrobacter sp. SZ93C1]MBH0086887.1 BLUF domain-containing protein [Psychrobacter sp. SCQQ22]PYE38026.1 FAD-dependent sensor of blue light [Psychrobacter fozii]
MHITTSQPPENRKRHGEHILIHMTYIAKNVDLDSGIELTRALEYWRRYFEENNIVSALVISEGYFVQSFQGTRPAINTALEKILDEHSSIFPNIVNIEEIESRQWNGFLVKHLTSSIEDEEYALKSFSAGSDYNPYLMKSTQIESFLKAVFEDTESNKF